MNEIFIDDFEDEVQFYLDSDEILNNLNSQKVNKLRNIFPLFSYLYYQEQIPELQIEDSAFKLDRKIPFSKDKTSFIIPTGNQIRVDLRRENKPNSKYSNLEKILNSNNFTLNHVVDIEFFEYYQSQFNLIKDLNKSKTDFQKKPNLSNLLWKLKEENEKEFEYILSLDKTIKEGVIILYDILENDKINPKIFTSFLDTEKIHLQIANISQNSQQRNILIYYGFGNYYPFTRNINYKKICEKRLNRIDLINANKQEILKYIQAEFKLSQEEIDQNLLNLINSSQHTYLNHFNQNFSYQKRLEEFKGDKTPLGKADIFFSLNPKIRTKSAALIAYNMFKHKLIQI